MNRKERRKGESLWTVINVIRHDNGGTTITMRNKRGNVKTENYPPGAIVQQVICVDCRTPIRNGTCPTCGRTADE